ncbi:Type III restriction enzyme, res subunit (plasmid) [Legionella adelaidensis]|uniref:Type III restriction enzyme, res subunit n=1 Tax=Legionella adelaidensis TaxID=45056 RepID=A0A0W0R1R7_9GAMM|nr:DEAD/DEAH box helicase family protein [Legionella adelaidensis]KTC64905.1 Type III restriction enzyme, res subunit [Legionella adelaidensis]VEH85588.1 Type III restriction enzyme, res subunit [Legionella adelaidensis]
MKLSAACKQNLLSHAKKIYSAYLALDFFKNVKLGTAHHPASLQDICLAAIETNKLQQTLQIEGKVYQLTLTPTATGYDVKFGQPLGQPAAQCKKISHYTNSEIVDLLANQTFHLHRTDEGYALSNTLDSKNTIGGPGKIDLYRSHLVTLHNIIEKIDSEKDISSLLVALATGSGKTYVQALWMYILYLSGNNGIFGVPDKLVAQFRDDIQLLLPGTFMQDLVILREKTPAPEATSTIENINQLESNKIILGSSEQLLDQHYQHLLAADKEKTFLSFDEQHLLMNSERRRVRLIELAKNLLTMFLSATPKQETYKLAGNKPVAIMSNGQKQEAGQGQFPVLLTNHARNISDKNTFPHFRFWQSDFWQVVINKFLLKFTDTIQPEYSSAAASIIEDLPFYFIRKPNETSIRWKLQVPMARKLLCIVDDNESLVNFCHALEKQEKKIYKNGNIVDRHDVSDFFQLPDAEEDVIQAERERRTEKHNEKLESNEYALLSRLSQKSLSEQLKCNIFHNLIEYVLTDVTGLSQIEHNRLRKENYNDFVKLVISKFQNRDAEYYRQKLVQQIDPDGAAQLSNLLSFLSQSMHTAITQASRKLTTSRLHAFIDNWGLDDGLYEDLMSEYPFSSNFTDYAHSHLVLGVMEGMQRDETPIEDSKPFLGLSQTVYSLYDGDGLAVKDAKKRQRTSLEILNDQSRESLFTPNYLDVTEVQADNYFRLGFVGVYVSNKKTEGFSDKNLHTVVNVSESSSSLTNSPDKLIQGIGRNRGLDDTVVPAYIHALGRGQYSQFDLRNLNKKDYYPDLFKSQKKFQKQYIAVLGEQVGKEIIAWYYANMERDETINPDVLKRQILKFIASALRELNNQNCHNIKLSRGQLSKVVAQATKILQGEVKKIKTPYKLTLFIRGFGALLNFLSECYYFFKRFRVYRELARYKKSLHKIEQEQATVDKVFIKILENNNFKKLVSHTLAAKEFKDWLSRKAIVAEEKIKKYIDLFLQEKKQETLKLHLINTIFPVLGKMVLQEKSEQVIAALNNMDVPLAFINSNEKLIKEIFDFGLSQPDKETKILELLKKVPGLENLTLEDIVYFPQKVANNLEKLQKPFEYIFENAPLKDNLKRSLGHYLKTTFVGHLSAFFVYPDVIRAKDALHQENKAEEFIEYCLQRLKAGTPFEVRAILGLFKDFFQLEDFETQDKKAELLGTQFQTLQAHLLDNPFPYLNNEALLRVAQLIQTGLIPSLVNAFPLQIRPMLMGAATIEKIRDMLLTNGGTLLQLSRDNNPQLPVKVFEYLGVPQLPPMINPETEIQKLSELIARKGHEIATTNKILFLFKGPKARIKEFLLSDEFLQAISIVLPYTSWQALCDILRDGRNSKQVDAVVDALFENLQAGQQLSGDVFLSLINEKFNCNFLSTPASLAAFKQQMQDVMQRFSTDPHVLNEEAKSQFVGLTEEGLLPLLATFIKDDRQKSEFLTMSRSPEQLLEFTYKNKDLLGELTHKEGEERKEIALSLINQLVPPSSHLPVESVLDVQSHALQHASICEQEIREVTIRTFITSEEFKSFTADLFNPEDNALILAVLANPDTVTVITKKLSTHSGIDKNLILDVLRSSDASLENIKTLNQRLDDVGDFFRELDKLENSLDKNKVAQLLAELYSEIIFHPNFGTTIANLVGFLNENDFAVILDAKGVKNPGEEAKKLTQLLKVIASKDKEGLQQFMTFTKDDKFEFDNLPAKKILDNLTKVIEEVFDCHCHLNHHDKKGVQFTVPRPQLLNKISCNLGDIQVEASYSFFGLFSRRIFFLQGIKNGLSMTCKINADSNSHKVKTLETIQRNILNPLWWSLNVFNITHGLTRFVSYLSQKITNLRFTLINGCKAVANAFSRKPGYILTQKNEDSVDFKETTFDYSYEVNQLTPLTPQKAAETTCPLDVVMGVEDFVEKRPTRTRFFDRMKPQIVDGVESIRVVP